MIETLEIRLETGLVTDLQVLQGIIGPKGDPGDVGGSIPWENVTDRPETFPPAAHKTTHATGGTDALTPADIGAQPAGSYVVEGDSRLGDARFPTPHKSTHTTGGPDALTPGDIGAVPTSRSITAGTGLTGGGDLTANRTLAVSYGTAAGTACEGNDARLDPLLITLSAASPGESAPTVETGKTYVLPAGVGAALLYLPGSPSSGQQILATVTNSTSTSGPVNVLVCLPASPYTTQHTLPPGQWLVTAEWTGSLWRVSSAEASGALPVVTEPDSFTLSQSTHGNRWVRLTKTSGNTAITLPTGAEIKTGFPFNFDRAGAGTISFSGGTVNGSARLADVPVNGAFGLVYLGSGTYDFV
jgi:hypothetical protein